MSFAYFSYEFAFEFIQLFHLRREFVSSDNGKI